MPVIKSFQRSRKFGNEGTPEGWEFEGEDSDAGKKYSGEEQDAWKARQIAEGRGEKLISGDFFGGTPTNVYLTEEGNRPLNKEIASDITIEVDEKIKLAEDVLSHDAHLTSKERRTWVQEYKSAWNERDKIVAEYNTAAGFHGATDEIIDVETEKAIRHKAFVSGGISDLNTTRPGDIQTILSFKDSASLTKKEKFLTSSKGPIKNPEFDYQEVRMGASHIEEGNVLRDMRHEARAVGNLSIEKLENRADLLGTEAITEEVTDEKTGKKKKVITDPDLMSYGQAQSRGRLSIDMASLVKGPFGINEIMLMGHDFDEGVREHPKYDLDSYKAVGKKVLGADWDEFYEAATTPGLRTASNKRLQYFAGKHQQIEKTAPLYKAIKKDIVEMSAGFPEAGGYKSDKSGIDLNKGAFNAKTIESYFSGKYGNVTYGNQAAANIIGKNAPGIAKRSNLPATGNIGVGALDTKFDKIVTGGALSLTGEISPRGFKGQTNDYGMETASGTGRVDVTPNPDAPDYTKRNTQFQGREGVASSQQKQIAKNVESLRRAKKEAMEKAIRKAAGLGGVGIIGIGKKLGGGGGQFSK